MFKICFCSSYLRTKKFIMIFEVAHILTRSFEFNNYLKSDISIEIESSFAFEDLILG